METLTLNLSTLYADHHVTEVRRLLLELPGVEKVYASSCFQVIQITFDPERTNSAAIEARLGQAGYLEDLKVTAETGIDAPSNRQVADLRHTAVYEQTARVVGFAQDVRPVGMRLWPCPGMDRLPEQEAQHGEERS